MAREARDSAAEGARDAMPGGGGPGRGMPGRGMPGMGMARQDGERLIAVDGGGSRCRLALAIGARRIVVETGPANVSTDLAGAVAAVAAGLDRLAAEGGLGAAEIRATPAFVGLAGMTGPEIEGRLRAALPLTRMRIADDRLAALRGALGGRDGCLAHCGTGSFFAMQAGGTVRLAGGWGMLLGDEASAQWAGRAALSRTLAAVDGIAPHTPLTRRLLDRFGSAAAIVRHAAGARPPDFGALAPEVTRCAAAGDAAAERILARGAAEIAATLEALGWRPGLPVCLTGGIGPAYAAALPPALRAALAAPLGTPLDGALALAREFATELRRDAV